VACVVEGVESDDVAVEERPEECLAGGEGAEQLRAGERAVQEKAQAAGVEPLAQEAGQQHEVVVVDPDVVVVGGDDFHEAVAELFVGRQIGAPLAAVEAAQACRRQGQQVMHERPQRLLAEALSPGKARVSLVLLGLLTGRSPTGGAPCRNAPSTQPPSTLSIIGR